MDHPNIDQEAAIRETVKFKRTLLISNILEISAGIVVIVWVLIRVYNRFNNMSIFFLAGSVLIATAAVYIILYVIKNRIIKGNIPSKDDGLLYFKYWLGWYENTLKLAKNIFWWYLLPILPGIIMYMIGGIQIDPEKSIGWVTIFTILCAVIYWSNRYYYGNKLKTKIDRMNHLISELER